jgi:hypothetical protein
MVVKRHILTDPEFGKIYAVKLSWVITHLV